jgi:hypothetical protein
VGKSLVSVIKKWEPGTHFHEQKQVGNGCDDCSSAVAGTVDLFQAFPFESSSIAIGDIPCQLMNLLSF